MSSHTSNLRQKSNACAPKCTSKATVTKWLSHFISLARCDEVVLNNSAAGSSSASLCMCKWLHGCHQVCSNVWKISKMATGTMLLCLAATDHNCLHEMQQYILLNDDWQPMVRKTTANLNLVMMKGRTRWQRIRGIRECCQWAPCWCVCVYIYIHIHTHTHTHTQGVSWL